MALTRTFKISGSGCLAGVVLLSVAGAGILEGLFEPLGLIGVVLFGTVFAFSALRALLRGLLWRVGTRLLVSYLLLGLVPMAAVLAIVYLTLYLLAGQLAVRRVDVNLTARRAALRAAAQELVASFPAQPGETARQRLFDAVRDRLGSLEGSGWLWLPASGSPEGGGPVPAAEAAPLSWPDGRTAFLTRRDTRLLAAAAERTPAGLLVVYLPLDRPLENALGALLGAQVSLRSTRSLTRPADAPKRKTKRPRFTVNDGKQETEVEIIQQEAEAGSREGLFGEAPAPEGEGPIYGRWVAWMMQGDEPVLDWGTGQPLESERLGILVRTSLAREFRALFGTSGFGGEAMRSGQLVVGILRGVSIFGLSVYLVAAALAAVLVLRIARATRRLSTAFAELSRGDFAYRATLRGSDQLSSLVGSFNDLAARLQASVAERAEKEALEHELQVARDLQRRLLPPPDFRFPGVEIAADFCPASAIGGDFYYLSDEGDRRLVVAIADVSGHGLPTGIVMASARASLAALSTTGVPAAELFATLDSEIRLSTDRRTFVTLLLARFRLADSIVEVTNAGHLYPYRVDVSGSVTSVANPARPLGVNLPATFSSVTSPALPGDLWVFLSDGIVEAMSPAGEVFGFPRLEEALVEGKGLSAAGLLDHLLGAWRAFTGGNEPEDDRTLIVLRIEPEGRVEAAAT